jgi:DNA-binding LacI/PurR family transcriptional regulator
VSSIDVARAAGVSQATVSYVFNGRRGYVVPDATRNRVLDVANELGYTPNKNAQSLKTGKTKVIALWMVDVKTPIAAEVLRRVVSCVEADNYEVVVGGSGQSSPAASWPVDGIIGFDSRNEMKALLDRERYYQVPIVSVGPYSLEEVDHVSVSLYPAAYAAMKRMAELGHRRIAYMSPPSTLVDGDERFEAYRNSMVERGEPLELVHATHNSRSSAREDIKAYIAQNGLPSCLYCYNDEIAVGMMRGLHDLHIRVPEDIAVFGCDGISETLYHYPSISTIVQPIDEMVTLGWTFLFNRLNNPELPIQQQTLSATFIDRESTTKKD